MEEDNSSLVRDFLIRKYSYRQAMSMGTFSRRVTESPEQQSPLLSEYPEPESYLNQENTCRKFYQDVYQQNKSNINQGKVVMFKEESDFLLYDDGEEVLEDVNEFDDYGQAVSEYLNELDYTQSCNNADENHVGPWAREPLKQVNSLDLDEYRSLRRLSTLTELNEEVESTSPSIETLTPLESKQIPLVTVMEPSGDRLAQYSYSQSVADKTEIPKKERTSRSFDSFLNQKKQQTRRQFSDSCVLLGPDKAASDLQGCLSPKSLMSTSRLRPLKFSLTVSSSCSLDCDSSPTGSDQSNTLVPLSSPSPPSLSSSGSDHSSLSAFSSSASPTYATPALSQVSSPLLSPQCSFYSCSSSPFMSPQPERDNLAPDLLFNRAKSLSVKNKKFKEDVNSQDNCMLRRVSSVPGASISTSEKESIIWR